MPRQTTRATVLKARKLRKERSLPEALLWRELRQSELKFRQQHPAGPFVVDFYCPTAKTCIEIDGIAHDLGDRPESDARRTQWLEAQGYRVVRIAAREVLKAPGEVAEAIVRLCQAGS
jgi:very-short-patch-repair endonuclease